MKKVLVIGCPGSGKSTFARQLNEITDIPLFYLDMIFHRADKTTVSDEEFDAKLHKLLTLDSWILDGNYARTLAVRLKECDTVFWLDYPLEVCLSGIEERRGKKRVDMPWIETERDEEFLSFVKNFKQNNYPEIQKLLNETHGKQIHIFKSREATQKYLDGLKA